MKYTVKLFDSHGKETEYEVSNLDIETIKKEIGFGEEEVAMAKTYIDGKIVSTFHLGQDWQYYVTYEFIDGLTDSDVIYVVEGQNPVAIAKQNMPFLAHDVDVEIL
jgi:hypothetical protein